MPSDGSCLKMELKAIVCARTSEFVMFNGKAVYIVVLLSCGVSNGLTD